MTAVGKALLRAAGRDPEYARPEYVAVLQRAFERGSAVISLPVGPSRPSAAARLGWLLGMNIDGEPLLVRTMDERDHDGVLRRVRVRLSESAARYVFREFRRPIRD